MEAIAMRMTQEEFDSIKGFIECDGIDSFDERSYLVNNIRDKLGSISNLDKKEVLSRERKVYEYFDKDIFLKACDIEVENVWKASELQFRPIGEDWRDHSGRYEFRLKPQPDYSKEIESLQEKAKMNGMKVELIWSKL